MAHGLRTPTERDHCALGRADRLKPSSASQTARPCRSRGATSSITNQMVAESIKASAVSKATIDQGPSFHSEAAKAFLRRGIHR